MYYHVFIDAETLSVVQSQATKLLTHSASLEDWNRSIYANFVRFCDSTTLRDVAKLWELYAIKQVHATMFRDTQKMLKGQWEAAKRYQAERMAGTKFVLDGLRSVAPLLGEGMHDVSARYNSYWTSGTCFENKRLIKKATIANPLFACKRGGLMLHYCMTPTSGYHLSSAFAQLSATSVSTATEVKFPGSESMTKDVRTAFGQLNAWCSSFRRAVPRVTIRYVNADAIALCHVLQHQQTNHESSTASWFRNSHTYATLVLDSTDYTQNGSAPTDFDVIDTSNLLDHLGALNLLTACVPLLRRLPTSTL